ncbi:rhodanese-like domain-containing protein [Fulvivirgaceae bacterium LMO-SS25]
MDTIHASEFQEIYADKKDSINLIDVRTAEEFESGHIPTAMNIDIRGHSFTEEIAKLPKEKTYHLVCRSGARSASACEYMESIGFKDVINVAGGMLDWEGETD